MSTDVARVVLEARCERTARAGGWDSRARTAGRRRATDALDA